MSAFPFYFVRHELRLCHPVMLTQCNTSPGTCLAVYYPQAQEGELAKAAE